MKLKNIFQRKETKYLLSQRQFNYFFEDLQQFMKVDQYGLHNIRSLYFDTPNYYFIRQSMKKPRYKEKFRVRSYGEPVANGLVFLEIKKKVKGVVYKRRVPVNYEDFLLWIKNGALPEYIMVSQVGQEIAWLFCQYNQLSPKVLITYDRFSLFMEEDDNFRVTFDQNIRYENKNISLDTKPGELVAPEIDILMEVKAMGSYPLWFVALLNKYGIKKGNFSKYAETYQRYLAKEDLVYVI